MKTLAILKDKTSGNEIGRITALRGDWATVEYGQGKDRDTFEARLEKLQNDYECLIVWSKHDHLPH